MQTFDFLNDSHKKSYKQYNYMQPEWLQPPKGEELFTNWIDPYVPKNSQVFRDLCTLICIILFLEL